MKAKKTREIIERELERMEEGYNLLVMAHYILTEINKKCSDIPIVRELGGSRDIAKEIDDFLAEEVPGWEPVRSPENEEE